MQLHLFILLLILSTQKLINQWASGPFIQRILFKNNQTQTLKLKLQNIQNVYYAAKIQLGEGNKTYNCIIDTGSSQLWVAGQDCQQCSNQGLYNLYDCEQDKKCTKQNILSEIDYGVGSVKGQFITSFATIDKQQMQIDFLLIDDIRDLQDFIASGLIGLGKNLQNTSTLPELLYKAGVIPSPEFSLYLTSHSCQEDSILTLGSSQSDLYVGEMKYAHSKNLEYWTINFKAANLVKENQQEPLDLFVQNLLIDSATTKILFPQKDLEALISSMQKQFSTSCNIMDGGSQPLKGVECSYHSEINEFPNITFFVQSVDNLSFQLVLTPSIYLDKCYFSIWSFGLRCLTNFQVMEGNEIILGVTFMQNYYTNFNFERQTIGFAHVKERPSFTSKELIYKSLDAYSFVFLTLFSIISCLNGLYCMGKSYIYFRMDLYASVLEKSSTRSDREQELSNMKQKTSNQTQNTVPSLPQSNIEFQEIISMEDRGQ